MTLSHIERALASLDRLLEPAGTRDWMAFVASLAKFGMAFGIKVPEDAGPEMVAGYRDVLPDAPSSVLFETLQAVRRQWTNRFNLPMPSDLVKLVPDGYWKLRSERRRLLAARDAASAQNYEPNPDELASPEEVAVIMRDLRQAVE